MYLGENTWPSVKDHIGKVIVVPLGSMEQHGHHLPLLTDTLIGTEIARQAELELGDEAVFLPILWVGASDHHRAYPGTVSISNEIYVKVLIDMLESLIGSGFRKIFLLNAHGGNITPGRMAMYDVNIRHRDKPKLLIAFSSWFTIAADQVAALDNVEQNMVTHACELETSMIMNIRPELVKLELAAGSNIPFESAFYCPDSSRSSRVDVPRTFDQVTITGALGHPEISTPEKGVSLFDTAVTEVVSFVREFADWPEIQPH